MHVQYNTDNTKFCPSEDSIKNDALRFHCKKKSVCVCLCVCVCVIGLTVCGGGVSRFSPV